MSRSPDKIDVCDLKAKEVRSLGGNRGFQHQEVDLPREVRRQIEKVLVEAYHRYVSYDPRLGRIPAQLRSESKQPVSFNQVNTNVRFEIE